MRMTLAVTMTTLGLAALAHIARYGLLLANRDTLVRPLVAGIGLWLGVVTSVAAIAATAVCAVVLTRWLLARRAAAFAHRSRNDPRSNWALWLGCLAPPAAALVTARIETSVLSMFGATLDSSTLLVALASCLLPLIALVWALVYATELAKAEGHYLRMRMPIWVWWLAAVLSIAVSVFATLTSAVSDAQGIADNTIVTTAAYLLALVAVASAVPVIEGFTRRPVERPAHRWLVFDEDQTGGERDESPAGQAAEISGEPENSLESERTEAAA